MCALPVSPPSAPAADVGSHACRAADRRTVRRDRAREFLRVLDTLASPLEVREICTEWIMIAIGVEIENNTGLQELQARAAARGWLLKKPARHSFGFIAWLLKKPARH